MASIIDVLMMPDTGPLIDLAETLDGLLSVIAYDGKAADKRKEIKGH